MSLAAHRIAEWLDRDDVSENRAADEVRARADEVDAVVLAALHTALPEPDNHHNAALCPYCRDGGC
jgi:hypothetical protein